PRPLRLDLAVPQLGAVCLHGREAGEAPEDQGATGHRSSARAERVGTDQDPERGRYEEHDSGRRSNAPEESGPTLDLVQRRRPLSDRSERARSVRLAGPPERDRAWSRPGHAPAAAAGDRLDRRTYETCR